MYVVLFHVCWFNLFSFLVAAFTLSKYTHSGLMFGEEVWDASETRGNVGVAGPLRKWGTRLVSVFEVSDSDLYGYQWAKEKQGTKYDWVGVFGWPFGKNKWKYFFCFEYVHGFLHAKEQLSIPKVDRLTGNDIRKMLTDAIYVGPANKWKPKHCEMSAS